MENKAIKDIRRTKFLEKMKNKNNENREKSFFDNSAQINELYSQSNVHKNTLINQEYQNSTNDLNNPNNNFMNNFRPYNIFSNQKNNNYENNNHSNRNFLKKVEINSNYQNETKINFNELLEKISQFDYMINFQSILKKILLIILTIMHYLNYSPLENSFIFKYTLVVLEMSSLLFNKYYNDQKKIITDIAFNRNNNTVPQQTGQFQKIFQIVENNFKYFGHFFMILKFIKDLIIDLCIVFLINIILFLKNSQD